MSARLAWTRLQVFIHSMAEERKTVKKQSDISNHESKKYEKVLKEQVTIQHKHNAYASKMRPF